MECGLVDQKPQGREIQYHLKDDKMREIEKWMEQFKAVMATRYNQLDDVLARMKERKK
jgi:hypothetical protein